MPDREILTGGGVEAAAGNAAFAGHLADGHDLRYLADAGYLDERRAVFDRVLLAG
ncbi:MULTISPECIES: hypothetical protein [unclassified Streptosporangium]|uniref:hypothetical protein n=1 Tax=unclassified Streptosporangium TaxID=2632669 RepID=UPI002E2DD61B|nr:MULTISPECIES: hypothetical protein [unclassified Streptosporangium]